MHRKLNAAETARIIRDCVEMHVPAIVDEVQRRLEANQIIACPFCQLLNNKPGAVGIHPLGVRSFVPLKPVTEGHRLFIPAEHIEWDGSDESARAVGECAHVAGLYAASWLDKPRAFNLITSCGADATQTIPHVHVHFVPRHAGDGLTLPWSGQGD